MKHLNILVIIALCIVTIIAAQPILPQTIILKNVGLDKYLCQSDDKYGPSWFNKIYIGVNSTLEECNWNTELDVKSKTFTIRNKKSNQFLFIGSEFVKSEPLEKLLTAELINVTYSDSTKWDLEVVQDGTYKIKNYFSGDYIYSFVDTENDDRLVTWLSFGCAGTACEWRVSE